MKIKADKINELEKFGFKRCWGDMYVRDKIAIWKDGKILRLDRLGYISYHKPYRGRLLIQDLITAGLVEDESPKE